MFVHGLCYFSMSENRQTSYLQFVSVLSVMCFEVGLTNTFQREIKNLYELQTRTQLHVNTRKFPSVRLQHLHLVKQVCCLGSYKRAYEHIISNRSMLCCRSHQVQSVCEQRKVVHPKCAVFLVSPSFFFFFSLFSSQICLEQKQLSVSAKVCFHIS